MEDFKNPQDYYFKVVNVLDSGLFASKLLLYNKISEEVTLIRRERRYNADDNPYTANIPEKVTIINRDSWHEYFTDLPVIRYHKEKYNYKFARTDYYDVYRVAGFDVAIDYDPIRSTIDGTYIEYVYNRNNTMPILGKRGPNEEVVEYLKSVNLLKAKLIKHMLLSHQKEIDIARSKSCKKKVKELNYKQKERLINEEFSALNKKFK